MTSSTPLSKPESFLREMTAVIRPGENRQLLAQVRDHTVIMDVRREMGGDDTAPTPAEFLLVTLGGCVLNLARILAVEKEMAITHLEVNVTGTLDLEKAFGRPTSKRAGYSNIDVVLGYETNVPASEQEAFLAELIDRCPICETIMNGTPVQFSRKGD